MVVPKQMKHIKDPIWIKVYTKATTTPFIKGLWSGFHATSGVHLIFRSMTDLYDYYNDLQQLVPTSCTYGNLKMLLSDPRKELFYFSVRMVNQPIEISQAGQVIPFDNFFDAMVAMDLEPHELYQDLMNQNEPNTRWKNPENVQHFDIDDEPQNTLQPAALSHSQPTLPFQDSQVPPFLSSQDSQVTTRSPEQPRAQQQQPRSQEIPRSHRSQNQQPRSQNQQPRESEQRQHRSQNQQPRESEQRRPGSGYSTSSTNTLEDARRAIRRLERVNGNYVREIKQKNDEISIKNQDLAIKEQELQHKTDQLEHSTRQQQQKERDLLQKNETIDNLQSEVSNLKTQKKKELADLQTKHETELADLQTKHETEVMILHR